MNKLRMLALVASFFIATFCHSGEKDSAFLPFYFSTETLGNTFGVAGVAKGVGQPQTVLFGMGLYSDKASYLGYVAAFNYALSPHWLVSTQMYQARFNDNPYYLGEQGSNASPTGGSTITNGDEQNYQFEFKYLLPWGLVSQQGMSGVFAPSRPVSTASPYDSGVTSISVTPFYSERQLDVYTQAEKATGVEVSLDWDNRDSVRNPTKGSHSAFTVSMGTEQRLSDSWIKWEAQSSQYVALGPLGSWFDQQVLAFDVYAADTPTWDACEGCARPPEQLQARLGGLYRLRGFTAGRYHGRSALHYSMEYRVLPDWQPLESVPVLNYYDLPWWQWVLFAEAGRVADEFDLATLHSDMQWNLGGAVRLQVEGVVVRAEIAKGAEEGTFRVMINQPF